MCYIPGIDFEVTDFDIAEDGLEFDSAVEGLEIGAKLIGDLFGKLLAIPYCPKPTKVIFNEPATIVYFEDGSKTVVHCGNGDTYDKEKGLAMCIVKRVFGNTGYFNEIFKEFINA